MLTIIRVITYAWPFLWELLVGKKIGFRDAIKTKRKQVLFIIITVFSIGVNVFLLGKVIGISKAHLDLLKINKYLVAELQHGNNRILVSNQVSQSNGLAMYDHLKSGLLELKSKEEVKK